MRKAERVWHCPLQNNKKNPLALLPCFYGNSAGCETDRRQLGQTGETFWGFKKQKCLNLKVLCYVIPAAQSRENKTGRKRRRTVWKPPPPPQCPNKGRASLAIYGGVDDITRQSGAVPFSTTFTFFIVHWWHVWNVTANSPRSWAPPSLPLWPPWETQQQLSLENTLSHGSTCPASQLVGKFEFDSNFAGSVYLSEAASAAQTPAEIS